MCKIFFKHILNMHVIILMTKSLLDECEILLFYFDTRVTYNRETGLPVHDNVIHFMGNRILDFEIKLRMSFKLCRNISINTTHEKKKNTRNQQKSRLN